ncbi:hypothetical protein [Pseudocitrobacter sp. 73]|uniref:hypothetical protein n=1 Tax=Pseudocitrobacter sp. 73 TaxID=2605731 RepID=UPI0011EEC08D|nr:hypothetical protein [Pseudocitrobacter sp. 73]KAA1051815.1 hypothetical protein F0Q32_00005 [Pseudocitrobacter sp. 73]
MSIKPRNFDKNVEQQLLKQGVCSQEILSKYSTKEKKFFFNLLYIGSVGRRTHPDDAFAFSLYAYERRKHIASASRFLQMKRDIPLIQQVCNHLVGKWPDGYITTSIGKSIFLKSCKSVVANSGLIDKNDKPYNPPRNGIRSQLKDGRKCKVELSVANEISINELSLRRLANEFDQTGGKESLINQIEYILAIARANKSGRLPIAYHQSKGGRFCAEGAWNLQNCSRIIRYAALAGNYDVDIENCHYTLLKQMCERIGIFTPFINEYVRNKKKIRTEVATFFGCSENMAKEILIALIYGSNLTTWGALKKINIKSNELNLSGSWIDGLAKEIRCVRDFIIYDYTSKTKGHFKIRNDAGMVIKTKTEEMKNIKKATLLAHILHGAESWILQNMIRYLGDNIVLLQHDGVTCLKPVDTELLSDYIEQKTQYRVRFEIEELAAEFTDIRDTTSIDLDYDSLSEMYSKSS